MKEFNVELPAISDRIFDIRDYGACSGGKVSNTQAINNAIAKASENGGRVVIPAGIWLTGPVELKSNVTLELKKGALISFDKNEKEYPVIVADYEGQKRLRTISPIHAKDCENIAIIGNGVIDGNGQMWRPLKESKVTKKKWQELLKKSSFILQGKECQIWVPTKSIYEASLIGEPDITSSDINVEKVLEEASKYYDFYRPVLVNFVNCNKVLLEGVTFQNSPAWNIHPVFCTNLTIRDCSIKNPYYAQNGDGIDVDSCQRVHIHDVCLDVGDDALCLKAGKNEIARRTKFPTKDVYIHDCIVYHGHGGFVIGSEMSRGVCDVTVENCLFLGTDTGLRFKSAIPRGGKVNNIHIKDIFMKDIKQEAITFNMGYVLTHANEQEKEKTVEQNMEDVPEFCDITMENISCFGAKRAISIVGLEVCPVHDIKILDSSFIADEENIIKNAENIEIQTK